MTTARRDSQPLFSWKAALLAVLIGVISFSALIVLSAFAPDLEDKDIAGPHAYSKSALGYNFAVELLERTGFNVDISRDPAILTDPDAYGLLVVTPANSRDLEELKEVELDRYDPILVVLPKRWGRVSFQNRKHQARVGELSLQSVTELLQPFDDALGMRRINAVEDVRFEGETRSARFTDRTQLITSGPVRPIISVEEGTIFGHLEGTRIYILADPELMNTHGLSSLDNTTLMLDMFDLMLREGSDFTDTDLLLVFDTTLHGFERTRNLLRLLFEPPLLGATLFAFAAAGLLGWAAFVRFGKSPSPEPMFQTGRLTLIDSTAGLFAQTDREALLADEYEDLAERLAASELGYPDDLTRAQRQHVLAQAEGRQDKSSGQSSKRPSASTVKTPGQLVSFAQKYQKWKKDISHGRQ